MSIEKFSPLGLMSLNEKKIAALYAVYGKSFSEQEKLWKGLVGEEKGHAAILHHLDRQYGKRPECFSSSPHSEMILNYVSNFIDESLAKARAKTIDSLEALKTALSLELSMVERKYFDIFTPKQTEIEMAFEKINRDTKEHAQRLKKYLQLSGLI